MNVFVLAILFYLLYRFIGGFLIPLFRTTRHVRQQFHNMRDTAGGQSDHEGRQAEHESAGNPGTSRPGTSKVGEYIDFEEVK